MKLHIKHFSELTTEELFEIYKLRVSVFVEAQTYAREFYEKAGFKQNGNEFLEDGIPHIPMLLTFAR